jgi:aquaglyceroporin related protein
VLLKVVAQRSYRRSLGYICAQVLGGFVGAALVYANYFHAIDIFEGGHRTQATASIFATFAVSLLSLHSSCLMNILGFAKYSCRT